VFPLKNENKNDLKKREKERKKTVFFFSKLKVWLLLIFFKLLIYIFLLFGNVSLKIQSEIMCLK